MAVKLNRRSFDFAKKRVGDGHHVLDQNDDWSEHRPSAGQENDFIEKHGFAEYEKWFLGVDDEHAEGTKGRHKFPYGDFTDVHRCGVIAAEVRAAQNDYTDIEKAATHLLGMLDELRDSKS
ncbi:hypothetical protein [Sphaerisporangium sp. TRM90804]|uniref:hypothetical protein n=1 Tax=Sphaerisporangium sp. TRM90804 TaxID=3031113 RepID=UPI002447BF35|nr:hypothetical protein [Sphaerisporangium sp. TRM90804]MDH2426849.1 hypothetical protein [Sphaerisporangium sp. TRM90804]